VRTQLVGRLATRCEIFACVCYKAVLTSFYGHDITSMLQGCQHKIVTICYIKHVTGLSEQPYNKSDNFGKVVTSSSKTVDN
jgi:hypothetical protein